MKNRQDMINEIDDAIVSCELETFVDIIYVMLGEETSISKLNSNNVDAYIDKMRYEMTNSTDDELKQLRNNLSFCI